jgi:DNA-binding CsgD family transcriptional regulator
VSTTSVLCALAVALALVTIPMILIARAMESDRQRVVRLRSQGWSLQRIADRLGMSRSKVGRLLRGS